MKKFGVLLFLFVFTVLGNMIARENQNPSEAPGGDWNVIVVYNIYHSYYENRNGSGLIAEGVYAGNGSTNFDVHAETQDEAETIAKERCSTVCTSSNGRYIGTRTYNGKVCHAFETRKVASARATLIKK